MGAPPSVNKGATEVLLLRRVRPTSLLISEDGYYRLR